MQSRRKGSGDFCQVLVDTAGLLAEPIRSATNYDACIILFVAVIGCAALRVSTWLERDGDEASVCQSRGLDRLC